MKDWPDEIVDCCVTSPPYWGLRDYGTATWEGGDAECDHAPPDEAGQTNKPTAGQRTHAGRFSGEFCWKCGANRIDNQIGLEKTPEEYVVKMVAVFAEVKRVLKPEGTLWLNLGDSYMAAGAWGGCYTKGLNQNKDENKGLTHRELRHQQLQETMKTGLKPKDLCGIPWRVAFALQADGWWLRQDIIWHKPNPMPESVTDRCTKAHEYIFLLSKAAKYYYDADAIKEESINSGGDYSKTHKAGNKRNPEEPAIYPSRNKRSVWTVTTKPYSEAHFATFPPDLIEPCILAGCPKEVCKKCGKARERIADISYEKVGKGTGGGRGRFKPEDVSGFTGKPTMRKISKTTGFTDCGCGVGFRPGIVFDPFGGVATTALVAYKNRRNYIMLELNPEYVKLAEKRIQKEKECFGLFENDMGISIGVKG